MALSFPTVGLTPDVTTYTYQGHTWIWTGVVWNSVGTVQGTQGAQGTTGVQGTTGLQGSTGAQGTTGAQGATGLGTFTRYKFTAAGGETSISGVDDNSVTLAYTAGSEQVFLNGILLVRGTDYTATNGTSVTALTALAVNDIVEIHAVGSYNIVNAISVTTINAKGDLLVGTADDTIGRLAAGTDGYYLSADSTQSSGLRWSAVTTDPNPSIFMLMGA
jgi:hypothetical protein